MTTLRTQDVLAEAILAGKGMLGRYLAGFTDETACRQAPGLPNHVAWSLGHCALTMHRVAERIDGLPLPSGDFAGPLPIPGAPPSDWRTGRPADAFAPESIAFGSAPDPDPACYPSLTRCQRIYDAACDRLAAAARGASDAKLSEPTPWGGATIPMHLLVVRMLFHNGVHTGQIADLRRALAFKSVFS